MLACSSQSPTFRASRSALARLFLFAAPLALAACAEDPLAPDAAGEPVPAAVQAAEPMLAALTTAPIIFRSYRIGDHPDIYRMDAGGTGVTRVTSFSGDEVGAAVSWNHQRIALVRRRLDASNVAHEDIYLVNVDGSGKRWARAAPSAYSITEPSWSPDGSRLVVTVMIQGTPFLATLSLATGGLQFVWSEGHPVEGRAASYRPDGQTLILLDQTMRKVREVYPDGDGYGLVDAGVPLGKPTFSPDGKNFAYTRQIAGTSNMEIFVQNCATYVAKRLTYSGSYDGAPSYSPDGTRIAFESRRSGQVQIWTMSATGGTPTRITHTTTIEAGPSWSH
jgi:Tol biopolymer transport system component